MNAIRCLGVVVVAVAAAGCGSSEGDDFTDVSEAAVVGQKHWSYEDVEEWGEHTTDCATGQRQSPINIALAGAKSSAALEPLVTSYSRLPLVVLNNGHTLQVQVRADPASPQTLKASGKTYRLAQLHFHSGSEHTLDGRRRDMELHLVHRNIEDDNDVAVVGILLEAGGPSSALGTILEHAPKEKSEELTIRGATLDLASLVPENASYVTYAGSLTTPPCSEGVTWFVLTSPAKVSSKQVAAYRSIIEGGSFRPAQDPNGRSVSLFRPTATK